MAHRCPSSFQASVSMARSKYLILTVIALCSVVYGCKPSAEAPQKMVIEGWIEDGKEPIVMLHYAYPLDQSSDKEDETLLDIMANQLETMARVAIWDGEKEVVLTGQLNTKYMPPYIYTTAHMVGEAGHTYTIRASRREVSAQATTYVPTMTPRLDSISVRIQPDSSSTVVAYIHVPDIQDEVYYNAFLRSANERQLRSFPMSMTKASLAKGGQIELPVYANQMFATESMHMGFYASDSTQYYLHLSVLDDVSYSIWEGVSAQSVNQGMFFMSIYRNMPSNVSSGLGYWCGYNSREYPFFVCCDTTFIFP